MIMICVGVVIWLYIYICTFCFYQGSYPHSSQGGMLSKLIASKYISEFMTTENSSPWVDSFGCVGSGCGKIQEEVAETIDDARFILPKDLESIKWLVCSIDCCCSHQLLSPFKKNSLSHNLGLSRWHLLYRRGQALECCILSARLHGGVMHII